MLDQTYALRVPSTQPELCLFFELSVPGISVNVKKAVKPIQKRLGMLALSRWLILKKRNMPLCISTGMVDPHDRLLRSTPAILPNDLKKTFIGVQNEVSAKSYVQQIKK